MPVRPQPRHPRDLRGQQQRQPRARTPDVSGCPGRHSRGLWMASRLLASRRLELGPAEQEEMLRQSSGCWGGSEFRLGVGFLRPPRGWALPWLHSGTCCGIRSPPARRSPALTFQTQTPERPRLPSTPTSPEQLPGCPPVPPWTQHFPHLLVAVASPMARQNRTRTSQGGFCVFSRGVCKRQG